MLKKKLLHILSRHFQLRLCVECFYCFIPVKKTNNLKVLHSSATLLSNHYNVINELKYKMKHISKNVRYAALWKSSNIIETRAPAGPVCDSSLANMTR